MKKDTIYAGIFGSVVADALGVPYEFLSREYLQKNPATGMTGYGTYNQPPGTWSDDSSMTLATIDSLTDGIDYDDMISKFCRWIQDASYTPHEEVFDYGNTTYKSLSNYFIYEKDALSCGLSDGHSNGNGSLMRIMPVVLYNNAKKLSLDNQMELIDNVSALTHAHKISKASCNIYNFVSQQVLENQGNDFKELIRSGIDNSRECYDNEEYGCFNRIYDSLFDLSVDELSSKGYVVYSLEVALYCCYHTSSYTEAVLMAVNLGQDTDTNAMITGGLAALYYGFESIPKDWLDKIVKYDYIKGLCDKFYDSF